ncbi:MAG: hypothetical protein ACR2F2_13620 [Pyrinomonadaceae bacterium]
MIKKSFFNPIVYLISILFIFSAVATAQKKKDKKPVINEKNAVMWERVNISKRDLFYGPGGKAMMPNLSKITFIKEEKDGHNKKYRIKDGSGKVWVAKLGREARPETAAVRLLWALGYKSEINYLVPTLTIPGKGIFENVRLEARPDNIDRLDEWQWEDNPFFQTNELQGLKIMMVFLKNWDILDLQNKVLEVKTKKGKEYHYIVSDLGGTLGRLGNNNIPVFHRLGRSTGHPEHYIKSILVRDVEDGMIELSYKGKNNRLFDDITVENGKWLYGLLFRLSDKQISDAFRAANYTPSEVKLYTQGVRDKIAELSDLSESERIAVR